jgi:hypothetical protein
MDEPCAWDALEAEAFAAFTGEGRFILPAYSEFMPPPYVVMKPYQPRRSARPCTASASHGHAVDVTEYEQAHEIGPGMARIACHVLGELGRLLDGAPHGLSRALLADNPAWPADLAAAAGGPRAAAEPLFVALSLALSRTQDDKGNVTWTLFGASHDGAARAFWRSFGAHDRGRFARLVGFATGRDAPGPSLDGVRVLARPLELPEFARELLLGDDEALAGVDTVITFRPFAELPPAVRQGHLTGSLRLLPHPASLVFFSHTGYARLARSLPRARQIPLLHLFPRVEGGYGIRIPQSGWLDEQAPQGQHGRSGHRLVHHVARTHRWQRVARDQELGETATYEDRVSVALFSTDADELGLYGKPMARNAQIWNGEYELILDGPRATDLEIERAATMIGRGGRFGYRFLYPAMRAGRREIYWHWPLVARLLAGRPPDAAELFDAPSPLAGYMTAEAPPEHPDTPPVTLAPHLLARPGHLEAATLFDRDLGRARFTTANNLRNLLEFQQHCGGALAPALARALIHTGKHETIDAWLEALPARARDAVGGARCRTRLADGIRADATAPASPPDLTFAATATRPFEERLWRTIAALAEGEFRAKETADLTLVNQGRSGGKAAHAVRLDHRAERDLDRLADHLQERYRALVAAHEMTGRARIAEQRFRWQTDFPYRWSEAWNRNQARHGHERNVALIIPGANRREAVIMADHYDTAYMEDVYEAERGGDGLRAAAAGADDNHSATAALLCAAEVLLPLAHAGKLARDVWLVHLTGEEFPADCLGARMLARAAVERNLRWAVDDGSILDASDVRVVGAFVLDMIAHNNDHDRDLFQIAPGEGAAAAALAVRAHAATERWNRAAETRNQSPERQGRGRAQRQEQGDQVPPAFAHLPLRGEIRPEWDPRSALYNTDGQIFSDVGIPVVLFMENYDINRAGYHDTHDTMKNIDLDYAAALAAIAIETVADTAVARLEP